MLSASKQERGRETEDETPRFGPMQKLLRLLSDPTRLRILAALEGEELAVGEIADVLSMSQSRISNHLRLLKEADALDARREGAWTFYRNALAEVYEVYGAALIWRGEFDFFFIGMANPEFHQMVVTMFPNPAAYLLMLCDPQVTAALNAKENGLAIHWAYTAVEVASTADVNKGTDLFFPNEKK